MKKAVVIAVAVSLLLGLVGSTAVAQSLRAIERKYDLEGSFVAHPGYNWGGFAEGATWNYSVHIKEAMSDEYSVGSIHFVTGDISVVGVVEMTDDNFPYWSGTNLLACGTANYEGTKYFFMFLYSEIAMWFALSDTPYDTYEPVNTVFPHALRVYELHSLNPGTTFPWDPKEIH